MLQKCTKVVNIKKVQIGTTVPNRYIRVIPNDTDGLIAPLEAHGELRAQISGAESPGSTLQTDPFSAALSPALVVHLGRSSGGGVMTPPGG